MMVLLGDNLFAYANLLLLRWFVEVIAVDLTIFLISFAREAHI